MKLTRVVRLEGVKKDYLSGKHQDKIESIDGEIVGTIERGGCTVGIIVQR